jgi:hypothetical protein
MSVNLRGDPRRKSLCAAPLKFNYVIKGWLKVISMQKIIVSALSIKSGDHRKKPFSEDSNLHIIGILRFFTLLKKNFSTQHKIGFDLKICIDIIPET